MNKSKVVLSVIGLMLIVVMAAIFMWPKTNSWYLTLKQNNQPYDVDFLYELIEESNENIEVNTINDFYEKSLNKEENTSNILKIEYSVDLDSTEVVTLLDFVKRGNKAFFITRNPPKLLLAALYYDSLRMAQLYKIRNLPYAWEWEGELLEYDSLKAAKDKIKKDMSRFFSTSSFRSIDTQNIKIGQAKTKIQYLIGDNEPYEFEYEYFDFSDSLNFKHSRLGTISGLENFIKVNHGNGAVYFHVTPLAFTNFHLIKEPTLNYSKALLNEFNKGNVYIDVFHHYYRKEYSSNFKNSSNPNLPNSPLAFILSIVSLKWAWYLTLAGVLVFVIFRSKRDQRIIPVITPIKNNSLEFSKTVGRLFFKEKNHKRMAQEVCQYFFNFLRKRYHINTKSFDEVSKLRFMKLFPYEKRRINIIAHLSVKCFTKETEITQKELEDLFDATRYFILKSK